jgi:hypothetical protein
MGNRPLSHPIHGEQKALADLRRDLLDTALRAAAKHFTHEEFRDLERALEAGRVDVRVYEGGLVLMRVAD